MMTPPVKEAIVARSLTTPSFRYIPKSHCKDGEAQSNECETLESTAKIISKFKVIDRHALNDKGALPFKIQSKQVVRASLYIFIASSKGSIQEEHNLPRVRTDTGFDPNTYKLMMRSICDFNMPLSLGHVIEAKPHDINEKQKKIQEQGVTVAVSEVGLYYVLAQPIRISGRLMDK